MTQQNSQPITSSVMVFSNAPDHIKCFWNEFFEALTEGMTEIDNAWQTGNMKNLAAQIHSYKGQVMLFQYHGLYQRFEALEHCVFARDTHSIKDALSELTYYFQQEVQRYETYKNSHCG